MGLQTEDGRFAGIGSEEAPEQSEQRGLACAVRSHHSEDFPRSHLDIEWPELEVVESFAEISSLNCHIHSQGPPVYELGARRVA